MRACRVPDIPDSTTEHVKALVIIPRNPISGNRADWGYLFPLGLGYVSSVLRKDGHNVRCLNLNHHDGSVEDLVSAAVKPDDVVLTGGLSVAYRTVKRVVGAVRAAQPTARVVLGGGLVSSEPELICNALLPDYAVLGEGEETIRELAHHLDDSRNCSGVAGLARRRACGGFAVEAPRQPIRDLDSLPWPDFNGADYAEYMSRAKPTTMWFYDVLDNPRPYPIITSRSCPYTCSFCYHPIGQVYRQRSIAGVMEELAWAVPRFGVNLLVVYDELFSANRARVEEFCKGIENLSMKHGRELLWTCQMRVDRLSAEMLARIKSAGCFMVGYGFESYSPRVLDSMKKHISPEQIDRAIRLTLENGMSVQGNFIFGDRAETMSTAQETLGYWRKTVWSGVVLGFIQPYPGTALYKHCLRRGIIKNRIEFLDHVYDPVNMSDTMTAREFDILKAVVVLEQGLHYVVAVPRRVARCLDGTFILDVVCPHCGREVRYRNYNLPSAFFFRIITYCRHCRKRFWMVSLCYIVPVRTITGIMSKLPWCVVLKLFAMRAWARGICVRLVVSGRLNLAWLRWLVQT